MGRLLVWCVLAGVLAMHALTMNHDPGMAQLSAAGVSGDRFPMTSRDEPAGAGRHLGAATMAGEPMSTICLAILGATALFGLGLLLRWLRSARTPPRWSRSVVVSPVLLSRSPPYLTPSLSFLCVLRI